MDDQLRKGPATKTREFLSEYEQDYRFEKGPYAPPVQIVSGTFQATGVVDLGGTINSTGGTIDNTVFGTPNITGGTARNTSLEDDVTLTSGTVSGGEFQFITLGTPSVVGGTVDNAVFGTPAITGGTIISGQFAAPDITGTPNLDVNSGTEVLSSSGDISIQTAGGSALLVANVGGTTYYWTPAGEL